MSITQHTARFNGFCCENKVWPWVLMTCLTHGESNPQPWSPIHQIYVSTSIYSLQQAQGFPPGLSYDLATNFLYINTATVKPGFVQIFVSSGIRTLAPS